LRIKKPRSDKNRTAISASDRKLRGMEVSENDIIVFFMIPISGIFLSSLLDENTKRRLT
jgi:hypothetical protein